VDGDKSTSIESQSKGVSWAPKPGWSELTRSEDPTPCSIRDSRKVSGILKSTGSKEPAKSIPRLPSIPGSELTKVGKCCSSSKWASVYIRIYVPGGSCIDSLEVLSNSLAM
jgi:hypothetical protein